MQTQRIIFSNNGTLTDWTTKLSNWDSYTVTPAIVAAEDYIYIASVYPFNHKWIELGTVNAEASTLSVEIWNNSAWEAAVDEIDYTSLGDGSTLSKSGIIQFRPHIDKGWSRERLATDVTGISGFDVYNMYWCRLKFSADLTAGMTIKYIGNRFTYDDDLFLRYPDLRNTNLMTAFESGKTAWDDQHFAAADEIISRLVRKNIIVDKSQILDWELFKSASIHKVAEIAYYGLGKSKEANRAAAQKEFENAINLKYFKVDQDQSGTLNNIEHRVTTGELRR